MGKDSLLRSKRTKKVDVETAGQIVGLLLNRLRPNAWNTKDDTRYAGQEFDELVASIQAVGVLQPILVRPVEKAKTIDHEIVFGERRFMACRALAKNNGGLAKNSIPCMVRKLSDDEAFDLTIVENLQRKDLDPVQEAEAFARYLEKHGEDAAAELADKINISVAYIHRRVAVLKLPRPALKAWRRGQVSYGHLEQLRRLKDKKQIARFVGQIVARSRDVNYEHPMTVRELKADIDMASPTLKKTIFDKRKAGCGTCFSNSNVQHVLFETGAESGLKCLDPVCFKQQVNNHLLANWEKAFKPKYGTNGFRFEASVHWNDYKAFYGQRVLAACKRCESFVTLVRQTGEPYHEHVCVGDQGCYKKLYEKRSSGGDGSDPETKAEKRSKRHGEEFRELFYEQVLPDRLSGRLADDDDIVRSALLSFYDIADWSLCEWLMERMGFKKDDPEIYENGAVCHAILDLSKERCQTLLKDLAIRVLMTRANADQRRAVADLIGIDLQSEWVMTKEYLKKKTIAEIMAIGKELGLFDDPAVQKYAMEKYPKCRPKGTYGQLLECAEFGQFKKSELIDVILGSGVDLTGKVPEEIVK